MGKNRDKVVVDGSKVKEENLEVGGGKCWKNIWMVWLELTGELFIRFPLKVILIAVKAEEQRKVKKKHVSLVFVCFADSCSSKPCVDFGFGQNVSNQNHIPIQEKG